MCSSKRKLDSVLCKIYSKESFKRALQLIEDGVSEREAASICKVPCLTLSDQCASRHVKNLGQSTLSPAEASDLVSYIILLSDWGFPLNCMDLHFWLKITLTKRVALYAGSMVAPLSSIIGFLKNALDPMGTRLLKLSHPAAIEIDRKLP
jgi:hypothetical protein